jgi:hypothetical protein
LTKAASVAAAALLAMLATAIGAPGGSPAASAAQPSAAPSTSAPVVSAPATSHPFPSPSPEESPTPSINGYGAALFDFVSGSGGTFVPAGSTAPPLSFPASTGHGFTLDVSGKLSRVFSASLRHQDDSFNRGDRPLSTTTEGAILYDPNGQRGAIGLGIISYQRFNGVSSATGGGFGGTYLPDTDHHISAFGKLFFYPSLSFPEIGVATPTKQPARGSLLTYQLGVAVAPNGSGGLFFAIGLGGHSGGPSSYSPQSVNALQFGIGSTF